jgi:hypothetical protein
MTSGKFGFSARIMSGGDQAGRTYLPSILAVPDQAMPARPTPTGKRSARRSSMT